MFLEGMIESELPHIEKWKNETTVCERYLLWCEKSENKSKNKTTWFHSYSIYIFFLIVWFLAKYHTSKQMYVNTEIQNGIFLS